jgi:hypothetical protein
MAPWAGSLPSIARFPVAVALLVLLSPMVAADYDATGSGGISCQEILDDAADKKSGPTIPGYALQWASGFLTGMNAARGVSATRKEPVIISRRDLRHRLTVHCQDNPRHDLFTAATTVYLMLVRERGD